MMKFTLHVVALLVSSTMLVAAQDATLPPVTPPPCTLDAKVCPDGSTVGRVPPDCEFAECPSDIICTADVKECPDGSFVSRVPPDCEFEECPTSMPTDASVAPTPAPDSPTPAPDKPTPAPSVPSTDLPSASPSASPSRKTLTFVPRPTAAPTPVPPAPTTPKPTAAPTREPTKAPKTKAPTTPSPTPKPTSGHVFSEPTATDPPKSPTSTSAPATSPTMMPTMTMNETISYVNCSEYQVEMAVPGLENVMLYYVVQYHSMDDTNTTDDNMSNETYGTMSVRLEYSGQGWLGFAVSPDGGMNRSDAVVGVPSDDGNGTVSEWKLGYGKMEELGEDEQTLISTSIMQDEDMTVMEFTRYLDEGEVPINGNGFNYFLVAYGSSNELGYHAARASFNLTLSPCMSTGDMMDDEETEETMTEGLYTAILRSGLMKKEEEMKRYSDTSGAESMALLGVSCLVSMVAVYGLV